MDIPQNVDGPMLAQNLTELYEVSQKSSYSKRIPFFRKWQKVIPDRLGNSAYSKGECWEVLIREPALSGLFYNFEDVQNYLTSHFGRGLGTRPQYDSYQAYQLIREQFKRDSVIYTFKVLPAPDSIAVLSKEKIKEQFTHVKIRSKILSWPKRRECNLEDLF